MKICVVLLVQVTLLLSPPGGSAAKENCLFRMCNEIGSDYPEKKISKLARKGTRFSEMYGDVIQPFQPKMIGRFGTIFGDKMENVCETRQVTMFPRMALNVNNTKTLIVNLPGYYQGVVFQYCVHAGKSCIEETYLPKGFGTRCTQQYVKVRMVAYREDGGLIQDYFAIPSGCACTRINTEQQENETI